MKDWVDYLRLLPEVKKPEKKLDFNEKLKWTLIVLGLFFFLSVVPLYGLSSNYVSQLQDLSLILAAKIASLISLGIGPIVSGSIILQLLKGADVIKLDTNSKEGKEKYQLIQKGISVLFVIIMNAMYVFSGAIPPASATVFNQIVMIVQLVFGGLLLMLFDEICTKWGFGSGISLFIAAGVSQQLFTQALSLVQDPTSGLFIGYIPLILQSLLAGNFGQLIWPLISVIATVAVFLLIVFASSIKVNIPLTLGRVRGYNIKWPIKFFYTSNIPVIFAASLIAMVQMLGLMLFNAGIPILGEYSGQSPTSGFASWLVFPSIRTIITNGLGAYVPQLIFYPLFMIVGCVLFSILWVQVGGQDAGSVADQIHESGLSIPGFRRDKRILERVVKRYIDPLTILGAISVAALAVVAELFSALTSGTGLLLSVMIIYGFYENIKREGMQGANPTVKKLLEAI
ncbi:MAG: preprotein translocase subunit SecY [Candidatus Nanoarchaeia archaeon]|nr:preprotein translocase subunit SecY [Candidatus Nanoarchaeia archaeon]